MRIDQPKKIDIYQF